MEFRFRRFTSRCLVLLPAAASRYVALAYSRSCAVSRTLRLGCLRPRTFRNALLRVTSQIRFDSQTLLRSRAYALGALVRRPAQDKRLGLLSSRVRYRHPPHNSRPKKALHRMDFTASDVVALGTGIAGVVASLNAYRKLKVEGRDSVITNFTKLTQEQRIEIDRLVVENRTLRTESEERITRLEAAVESTKRECEQRIAANNKVRDENLARLMADHETLVAELKRKIESQNATILQQAEQIAQLQRLATAKGGTI